MSEFGWAYVKGNILREAGGTSGSVQFKVSDNQITGSNGFTFDTETNALTVSGTLNVSGAINANELNFNVVNKSVHNISVSGSTNFGDTTDDNHRLTGSFVVSGSNNLLMKADASTGRIGIGITGSEVPSKLLHVFGDTKIEGTLYGGSPLKIAGGVTLQDGTLDAASSSISAIAFTGSGGALTDLPVQTYANGANNRILTSTGTDGINGEVNLTFDGADLVVSGTQYTMIAKTSTGRVGIKTNSPNYELEVNGDIGLGSTLYHNGDDNTKLTYLTDRIGLYTGGEIAFDIRGDLTPKRIDTGNYDFKVSGSGGSILFSDYSERKVGIKTESPTHDLSVSGTMAVSGSTVFYNQVDLSGAVNAHSQISSSAAISASHFYGDGSGIYGVTGEWDGTHNGDGQITGSLVVSGSGGLMFQAQASTGRVGINTLSPTHLLHVNGDVKIEGTLTGGSPLNVGCSLNVVGHITASSAITGSEFHGSAAGLTDLPVQTYSSASNNRILTSVDADTIQAEANLTFDGSVFNVSGAHQAFKVDASTGRVAINTGSSNYELEVNGDIGLGSALYHNGDVDTKFVYLDNRITLFAGGSSAIDIRGDLNPKRIDLGNYDLKIVGNSGGGSQTLFYSDYSANKIGIKTESPTHDLSISGTMAVSGTAIFETNLTASGHISSSAYYGKYYGDGSGLTNVTGEWDGTHNGNGEITGSLIISASAGQMFFANASTGKVAIGTGSADKLLHVFGDAKIEGTLYGGSPLKIAGGVEMIGGTLVATGSGIQAIAFTGSAGALTDLPVQTYTNGSNNRIITAAGADSINGEANLSFNGSQLEVTGNVVVSGSQLTMVANSSTGKVGIKTDSPNYELEVNGDIGLGASLYHNGDTDTKLTYLNDRMTLYAGGVAAIDIRGDTSPKRIDFGSNMTLSGSLVPSDANAFDLGSADKPWKDLYVSSSTIYFGSDSLSVVDGSMRFGHENATKDFPVGNLKLRDKGIFVPSGSVFDLFAEQMRFFGGVAYKRRVVAWDYTILIKDNIVGVAQLTASAVLTLPDASALENGQIFVIKDEAGNPPNHTITITTQGSDTIDGVTSVILESAYAAVNVYTNGTNKFFIY